MPVIRKGVLVSGKELRDEVKITRKAVVSFDQMLAEYDLRHLSAWEVFLEGFKRSLKNDRRR